MRLNLTCPVRGGVNRWDAREMSSAYNSTFALDTQEDMEVEGERVIQGDRNDS